MCGKTFQIDFDSLTNICKGFKPCVALRDAARERRNLCDEDSIFILFDDDTVFHAVCLWGWGELQVQQQIKR